MFANQPQKPDFNVIYNTIQDYRSKNHIFEQSIESRDPHNQFRFYDGPPFITGLPHYGHLASSVAKDVIPRYQTMKGKRVERVRGRDCHGIPIEQKVQKKLGLESNLDIEKVGLEKFIEECYGYTREMSAEWKRYVDHFARWVDFDNSYKTMDNDYMESVWRVFKTLWDKGLIYKGKRVSMYSTKLETPISHFEVAMDDSYDSINDPAITVTFDLSLNGKGYENTSLLVWTTTPWTIPVNIAAALHKEISYSKVFSTGHYYILATSRLETVFANKDYKVIEELKGEKLIGLAYKPPFNFLYTKTNNPKDHHIYHADFVSDTDGTGIVHEAPEFGEVDFEMAQQEGLTITEAMDSSGHYTDLLKANEDESFDLAGKFYRDANDIIMEELKLRGALFDKQSITHRVAFCPRSGTPLVYKAQDSWFIDINGPQQIFGGKSLKERAIEENENINRYPEHIKYGRFLKSVEVAPDRGISRTRFRGTPMPIYRSEDGTQVLAIGSREELYELSKSGSANLEKRTHEGKTIYRNTTRDAELDMHLPYIDDIRLMKDGIKYTRVTEVLDSWVESAAMPYAQVHYPFENKEKFEQSFPADYIVEYSGQIRARFYVMHILGVALFDKPAFINVVCHGVIAGNDGRKMSKSLGNYPDPKPTFEQYGGDAVRMSILTTSLFNGGDISFSEDLVKEALKQNTLPLWNAFSFFITYATLDKRDPTSEYSEDQDNASKISSLLDLGTPSTNLLDRWILGELEQFITTIDQDLTNYDLTHSSRQIALFLENLTNRYIRRSRRRFWKSENDSDKDYAYRTLYHVLTHAVLAIAPFMPIISEYIWRSLTQGISSVHLQNFPIIRNYYDEDLANSMSLTQEIVRIGLAARSQHNIRVRQPLASLSLGVQLDSYYIDIIKEELNIKIVTIDEKLNALVTKICKPNGKIIGQLFGSDTKEIFALAKGGQFEEHADGTLSVGSRVLPVGSYEISYIKTEGAGDHRIVVEQGIVLQFDWDITIELKREGYARDLIRMIQDARKEARYQLDDRIQLSLEGDYAEELINYHGNLIQEETLSRIAYDLANPDLTQEVILGDHKVVLSIKR